jgi:hypothetical protein
MTQSAAKKFMTAHGVTSSPTLNDWKEDAIKITFYPHKTEESLLY